MIGGNKTRLRRARGRQTYEANPERLNRGGYHRLQLLSKGTDMSDVERRLAAILAADVVGYSRLMEANEEATIFGAQDEPARLAAGDGLKPHRPTLRSECRLLAPSPFVFFEESGETARGMAGDLLYGC